MAIKKGKAGGNFWPTGGGNLWPDCDRWPESKVTGK